MQIRPTIITVLDTRHKKKTGVYPVKIRITFYKEQRYYPVGYDLTKEHFATMLSLTSTTRGVDIKLKRKLQDIANRCDQKKVSANEIIDKMQLFNFRNFEKRFLVNQQLTGSTYAYYEATIKTLKEEGRVGTAGNYTSSMNSLKAFKPKLPLRDVTVEFLKEYESSILKEGKSISTVGIYLRPLRAILNQAIEDGEFSKEQYPFGKRRYQIPAGKNIKKALTLNEIGLISNYKADPGTWFEKARDIFMFSYFANGINMKDILRLKYENIDGEYIRFIRAKTQRTNRTNTTPISFSLSEELNSIISRWGNPDKSPENYILPVLYEGITPEKEMADVQQFTKMVNKYLKLIVKEVGISKPVTSYFARHSFATVLLRGGVSTELISESLGHSSLKTTANYLGSFECKFRLN